MEILKFLQYPTAENWDAIAYSVIGGTPDKPITLLRAVRLLDSTFPRDKDAQYAATFGWSRIPSTDLVKSAINKS